MAILAGGHHTRRDQRLTVGFAEKHATANFHESDIATGQKTLWKQLMPPDPAGVELVGPILPSADGKAYVYGYRRMLSDLYLVDGLK